MNRFEPRRKNLKMDFSNMIQIKLKMSCKKVPNTMS